MVPEGFSHFRRQQALGLFSRVQVRQLAKKFLGRRDPVRHYDGVCFLDSR